MAFQIPIPGLFVDLETGSGSVGLPNEFFEAPAEIRAEVLQQWLVEFSVHRNAAVIELFETYSKRRPELSEDRLLEDFKQHCFQAGVDFPNDLPLFAETSRRKQ